MRSLTSVLEVVLALVLVGALVSGPVTGLALEPHAHTSSAIQQFGLLIGTGEYTA